MRLKKAVDLRTLVLPKEMRTCVLRLITRVEVEESIQGVHIAGSLAEGFVLGLETAGALKADLIEELYSGFELLSQSRLAEVSTHETFKSG